MRCMIGSLLDDDWSLTTSDRQLNPISYAWRRPRSLWSYDTVKTPRQLFAEHLKRRQRMIECLHIGIQTNLNADAYFEYERKTHAARKAILASKTYAAIRAEMAAFEDTPMSEWLGDFSQFADASDKK
jgi:hypothetical protein